MHELDEVLGAGGRGSALRTANNPVPPATGNPSSEPKPLDLFRFGPPTNNNGTIVAGPAHYDLYLYADTRAYFSIDGGKHDLAQFNQTAGGDFGDWYSYYNDRAPAQVQDAFQTKGLMPNLSDAETTALDVIGYTLNDDLPDLELTIGDSVGGNTTSGTNWTWTLTVENLGDAPATFSNARRCGRHRQALRRRHHLRCRESCQPIRSHRDDLRSQNSQRGRQPGSLPRPARSRSRRTATSLS